LPPGLIIGTGPTGPIIRGQKHTILRDTKITGRRNRQGLGIRIGCEYDSVATDIQGIIIGIGSNLSIGSRVGASHVDRGETSLDNRVGLIGDGGIEGIDLFAYN